MKNELTILVTGAGAPGIRGTLFCLRNNPDKTKVRLVGIDLSDFVVGRYLTDSFWNVPAPESKEYRKRIAEICSEEKVDLIVPQTTREITFYSKQKGFFQEQDIQVMVADEKAIKKANNKFETVKTFQESSLPFPEYSLTHNEASLIKAIKKLGYPKYPVVVKIPVSNGMRGLRIIKENPWSLDRFKNEKPDGTEMPLEDFLQMIRRGNKWPELLVSEYLPGPEYSVDAFIGENTEIALPRIRKAIRSGISFATQSETNKEISSLTLTAAKNMGLKGVFGFQFKLDKEGVPKVLECNPRIQGTMVASTFTGVNLIWMGVRECLGFPPSLVKPRFENVAFLRYWGGVGIVNGIATEI